MIVLSNVILSNDIPPKNTSKFDNNQKRYDNNKLSWIIKKISLEHSVFPGGHPSKY